MNAAVVVALLMTSFAISYAADATPTTNATTIIAASTMSPGRYTTIIAPNFNQGIGRALEKGLGTIPGVTQVDSHVGDSTVTFTIKEGAKVQVADLQKAVAKADAEAIMTTPVLDHSLATLPTQ